MEYWSKEDTGKKNIFTGYRMTLFLRRHPLTSDTEVMTGCKDIIKVQFGEPMRLGGGVTYKNMSDGLFLEADMTQRQQHQQKPTPAWVTGHGSWKPGAHCAAWRQLYGLECSF